jgi:hypothetical protein
VHGSSRILYAKPEPWNAYPVGPGYEITAPPGECDMRGANFTQKGCEELNFRREAHPEAHPDGGASVQFWLQRSTSTSAFISPDTS